jgi:CRISPR-associated protein Cst2
MVDSIKSISIAWLSYTDLTNLNSGEGGSNYVDIKKFKTNGVEYPYVSGQAMRSYLKEGMRRNLSDTEFMCIPDTKGETCGQVEKCMLCDLFGYMIPKKKTGKSKSKGKQDNEEEETAGGADTRVSPVKVSPAIGLFPFLNNSTVDFLTRRKPQEKTEERKGDIVNVELARNLYKCGIDIDIARIGSTEEIDLKARTISIEPIIKDKDRRNRVRKVIDALKYLSDYSKQSRLLTDFTPDVICISFQTRYSHRLHKLFALNEENGDINDQRLSQIISDIKSYSTDIYFGILSGVIPNENKIVEVIQQQGIKPAAPDKVFEEVLSHKFFS